MGNARHLMVRLRSIIRLAAALMCLGAAFLLLARSSLPNGLELNEVASKRESGATLAIGSRAPPFQLLNTSGVPVATDSAERKAVVINFWATYCAPCRQEMRDLQQLLDSRPDSVHVLAVNVGEPNDVVVTWKQELDISFDLLLDPTRAVTKLYNVRGIPTTFLLDSNQRIRKVYYGPVSRGQLDGDIQRLTQRA